jgi:hypothetical protein
MDAGKNGAVRLFRLIQTDTDLDLIQTRFRPDLVQSHTRTRVSAKTPPDLSGFFLYAQSTCMNGLVGALLQRWASVKQVASLKAPKLAGTAILASSAVIAAMLPLHFEQNRVQKAYLLPNASAEAATA